MSWRDQIQVEIAIRVNSDLRDVICALLAEKDSITRCRKAFFMVVYPVQHQFGMEME